MSKDRYASAEFENLLVELVRAGFEDHQGFVLLVNDPVAIESNHGSHTIKVLSSEGDIQTLAMINAAKKAVGGDVKTDETPDTPAKNVH